MIRRAGIVLFVLLGLASAIRVRAQELEPRAYAAIPLRTNFFALVYGHSSGSVILDPSVPITDVEAKVETVTAGYGRTFGLAKRQGLVTVLLPYANAHVEGLVYEQSTKVRRSGLADLRVKASINLVGPKATTPAEFATAPRKTIFGVSLTVQAPSGEYDSTKLVNLGTNRWALKPEVGVSVPVGRWSLETYGGAWLFTKNDAYFTGSSVKRQDPLTSLQGHVAYTFKTRAWLAFDVTWYGGGETTIDDGPPSSRFSNTRYGGTFSLPVAKRHTLKFAASRGASARTGSNFTTVLAGWQMTWFD